MAKKEKKQEETKDKKQKKGKDSKSSSADKKAGAQQKSNAAKNSSQGNINNTAIDRTKVSSEELTQAQIEEAIKESQDPSSKLKKLRSPLSVRGCLLNILVLVILTVAIVILCCYLMLDHETFNLWTVLKDMFQKFGITGFFKKIIGWFKRKF